MDIEFNTDEWHDPHRRQVVWFSAIVDEKPIDCGISIEALADHFRRFLRRPPAGLPNSPETHLGNRQ